MLKLPKKINHKHFQIDSTKSLTHPRTLKPLAFSPRPSPSVSPSRSTQCVGIGLVGLRGPMHLCACVSEERSNGEGAGSQALSLLSDSIFWEHQSAYTVTMKLNTEQCGRYTKRAKSYTHDTHTHTCWTGATSSSGSRALPTKQATCPCTDVFLQHCLLSE